MSQEAQLRVDAVRFALSELKRQLESRLSRHPLHRAGWKAAALKIESLRLELTAARREVVRHHQDDTTLIDAARLGLIEISSDIELMEMLSIVPFRLNGPSSLLRQLPPHFLGDRVSGAEGIVRLIELVEFGIPIGMSQGELPGMSQLRHIVPGQKIAPVQFEVAEGKIVVAGQSPSFHAEDAENIRAAREALASQGERVLEELSQSNCDPRLLESLRGLQDGIVHESSIVKLGIMNIACEYMCDSFKQELPEAICGLLRGQTAGIGMFVAQFPEWQAFSEKAASIDLSPTDISSIHRAASDLSTKLELNPEIADPEVPRTIRAIAELIRDPAAATKRAAFATLRTIENFVAKAFRYGGEFLDETAQKSVSGLSTAVSRGLVIALMAAAIASATTLGPVSSRISDAGWMRDAAEIVQRQLDAMAKD
jgi:hypothetical protein